MIYFVLYLFLEVIISVNISSSLGGLMTFAEIIFSAFIGISILLNFKKSLVENLTAFSYHTIDLEQFEKLNLFTLFGAILLIIPGFFTDILGILMQFSVITSMFVNRYKVKSGSYKQNFENKQSQKDSNVIDVEIIGDKPAIK